jgi:hypothetical protein
MTVRRSVNCQDHTREVHMHASIVAPQEPATGLVKMRPETVEGNPKAGNMEDIADEKTLAVERDDCRAPTQDGGKKIVTHTDTEALN